MNMAHLASHNEQVIFNLMLKEFGVRGVKVQEVFGLDEDMLSLLP
jgi:ubiquitin carboxyl-terminal hydrolase L5